MTPEDRSFLKRITDYAEEVLGDIDPQKTQVSAQLQKLRPIMQTLAMENGMSIEDVFIKYMDLASEAGVEREKELQQDLAGAPTSFSGMANMLK